MTNVFRNSQFTKRNHECTNIVACVADAELSDLVTADTPSIKWVDADEETLSGLTMLYRSRDVEYYGYL